MALQWHSSCVKTFVGIWKSGSTKCWLIFAKEGLFMTLKRRITFPITEETEHLNLITTPNNQAKCVTCKSTVETPFLFFTCVISTLSLLINIQKRFLWTKTSMSLVRCFRKLPLYKHQSLKESSLYGQWLTKFFLSSFNSKALQLSFHWNLLPSWGQTLTLSLFPPEKRPFE